MFLQIVSVFLLSAIEQWGGVAIGFAVGLPSIGVFAVTSLGAIAGAVVIGIIGDRLRGWLEKRAKKKTKEGSRLSKIWQKYGVAGLGLISPWLVGPLLGVAVGIAFKADTKKLVLWTIVGVVICSLVLSLIVHVGVSAVHSLSGGASPQPLDASPSALPSTSIDPGVSPDPGY